MKTKRAESLKKIFHNTEQIGIISKWRYKKLLKCLETNIKEKTSDNVETFYEDGGIGIIHITNEWLSKQLYKWVNSEKIDEFYTGTGIRYISLKKEERVVFVVSLDINYIDFNSFYGMVKSMTTNLSDEEHQVKVDYTTLFDLHFRHRTSIMGNDFIVALYLSLTLEDYTFDKPALQSVIENFLRRYERTTLTDWKQYVCKAKKSHDSWVKKGISIDRKPEKFCYLWQSIPFFVYSNICKFVIDENSFKNCEDFFVDFISDKSPFSNFENYGVIFNEEIFKKTLKFEETTQEFEVYSSKTTGNCEDYIFLKLKNPQSVSKIYEVLTNINDYCLYQDIIYLWSFESGDIYLCLSKTEACNNESMEKATSTEITQIILNVVNTFGPATYVKNNVYFNSSIDLLECMDWDGENITLANLQYFNFEQVNGNQKFNFPLIIFRIIQRFIEVQESQDIYSYEFMKILPPDVAHELIQYLKTGECNFHIIEDRLNKLSLDEYCEKIVFFDNLSSLCDCYVSFFEDVKEVDCVSSYVEARKALDFKGKYGEYASLDEVLKTNYGQSALPLTKDSLLKLFKYYYNDNFLYPTKVIISKDIHDNKDYTILGVVWNYMETYNLQTLLNKNVLNVREIYMVIYSILASYGESSYLPCNLKGSLDSIFLSWKANIKVLYSNSKWIERGRITYSSAYSMLIKTFEKNGYMLSPTFSYEDLTEGFSGIEGFEANSSKITLCSEHNEWYISSDLCRKCKNLYVLQRKCRLNAQTYKASLTQFYKPYYSHMVAEVQHKNVYEWVKLAIENNLYKDFTGIVPKKLMVPDATNEGRKILLGIQYDAFDFDGMMELSSFKHFQKLKVILVLCKKLLPKIIEGSFVCPIVDVYNSMFMHKDYKGEIIVPDIAYLQSTVILSNDSELKEQRKEATLKAFCKFLYNYLMSDEYFKNNSKEISEILKGIKNCVIDENAIKEYISKTRNYCKVHKVYYSENEEICPLCKACGVDERSVILKDLLYFDNLKNKSPMFEGGEANLYKYDTNEVQKIFNSGVNLEFKSKILGKAMEKKALFENFNKEHTDIKFVTVNQVLYCFEKNILTLKGYILDFIEGSYTISCLRDKEFVKKHNIQRKDVVNILAKVCVGIEFLHSIGAFIGDLNGGNILIKDDTVYFIDVDGMSMDDVQNFVYTNMYIYPPSANNKNITKSDDWYSLAVQAFYYLTYSHPFRGICDDENVPENEMDRMTEHKSVLGKHNICPPSISDGWDFLPKPMLKYFLETFEGNRRESMLKLLQAYEENESGTTLISSKLIYSEIPRLRESKKALTPEMYIDVDNNLRLNEQVRLNNIALKGIYGNYFVLKGQDENVTYVVDNIGKVCMFYKNYDNVHILDVCNFEIYYTYNGTVYKDVIDETMHVTSQKLNITRYAEYSNGTLILSDDLSYVIVFMVINSNTYVSARWNPISRGLDVFENDEFISSYIFPHSLSYIMSEYDQISNNRLVILGGEDSSGKSIIKGFIFKNRNEITELKIPESFNARVKNGDFYRNVLYYAEDKKICCFNVNTGKLSKIECDCINENSIIKREGNSFFIGSDDKSYVYTKS